MALREKRMLSKKKFPFLILLVIPIIIVSIYYLFISPSYLPKQRTSILFLTDPVEVASFDPVQNQWSRVQFSSNTHIAGIQGLGDYAIDSLWNIAATEGSPSAVVLGSVTDELGVPVEYFAYEKGKLWKNNSEYLSLSGIIQRLLNKLDTNIPVPLYIALTRSLRSTPAHQIHDVHLEKGNGLVEKKLADGSKIMEFDRIQFDSMTADIFEDSQIRDELLRIAVFNTTGRPFLGSRVARIVDRLGSNVIQVGNEDTPIDECELSGNKEHILSKTAQVIAMLFSCKTKVTEDQGRADLTVRIGQVYERRFTPPLLLHR